MHCSELWEMAESQACGVPHLTSDESRLRRACAEDSALLRVLAAPPLTGDRMCPRTRSGQSPGHFPRGDGSLRHMYCKRTGTGNEKNSTGRLAVFKVTLNNRALLLLGRLSPMRTERSARAIMRFGHLHLVLNRLRTD